MCVDRVTRKEEQQLKLQVRQYNLVLRGSGSFFVCRKVQNIPSYQVSVKKILDHYPQFVKISEVGKEDAWTLVHSASEHESKSDAAHTNHWVGLLNI